MTKLTRPALRYHGGKWRLAPWIISFFPKHRVYVEPFGGAASVLLRKDRCHAEVYNDMDGDVVNLFRVLRDRGDELLDVLRMTPFARDEFNLAYEETGDPLEQARRMVVRSFMGFGSGAVSGKLTGFRANSSRSHTTPAYDWANYPAALPTLIERLGGVIIENRDAAKVIAQHDAATTLIYADPPYVFSTRSRMGRSQGAAANGSRFSGYRHEMTDAQHQDLATVLHEAHGMVVLSGYACDLYDQDLYADWERHERRAMADGARARTEVVWLNPAASEALHAGEIFASSKCDFEPGRNTSEAAATMMDARTVSGAALEESSHA